MKMIAMMCWALWKSRNELMWNNKGTSVDGVIDLANYVLNQWARAQDRNVVPTTAFLTENDGAAKWTKPTEGVIKINVDAAIFAELGTHGFACVARGNRGSR